MASWFNKPANNPTPAKPLPSTPPPARFYRHTPPFRHSRLIRLARAKQTNRSPITQEHGKLAPSSALPTNGANTETDSSSTRDCSSDDDSCGEGTATQTWPDLQSSSDDSDSDISECDDSHPPVMERGMHQMEAAVCVNSDSEFEPDLHEHCTCSLPSGALLCPVDRLTPDPEGCVLHMPRRQEGDTHCPSPSSVPPCMPLPAAELPPTTGKVTSAATQGTHSECDNGLPM